ncbi:MAG: DNA polymerase III subunit alpha [Gemmatimonadaceae bacterium 4484_173]|nr:MAG: DNA polymerase III subunit alpha [Gemmatimonadaceae bacterium 4484_173]
MSSRKFVHLHLHSEYSLLDGAIQFSRLGEFLVKNGMDAVAVTDHGNMFGAVQFCDKMEAVGVKPIIGSEVYLTPGSMHEKKRESGRPKYYHLTLLAASEEGYHNLVKLSSAGFLEGFYYKPRIDREMLEKHCAGLIIGSACLQGEVAQNLLQGKRDKAVEAVRYYQSLVGKDRFFIELMDHGLAEEKQILTALAEVAAETGALPVATNDAHYLSKDDAKAHEILLCLQTGKTLDDPGRMKFGTEEFYVKTPEEMAVLFDWIPEAVSNSVIIADMCDFSVKQGEFLLPDAPMPDGYASQGDYLADLAGEGLSRRLGRQVTQKERERLEYELEIINGMGFPGYFLIVSELMRWARAEGIPVGPGRGSAAGSLVSFAVEITDVNPLDHDLSFERFLNPARAQMPDIDLDVCVERRAEIIEHIKQLYGEDSVCQIITYNRMKNKAAIRDVARVLGMSYDDGDILSRLAGEADDGSGKSLLEMVESNSALKAQVKQISRASTLMEYADRLSGIARHAGVHAAGVVITPGRLDRYVPLYWNKEKGVTTQYEMKAAEKIGLLKLDVLGLRTVTVIDHAEKAVKLREPDFSIEKIPFDDQPALEMISSGRTSAVFQLEGSGMREALRKIGVNRFDDVTAAVAIYRPGSMHMIDIYADNKKKASRGESISYPHPLLEEVLSDTYGVTIYQEQVMRIANVVAGMTMAEADNLRRAMSKKIASKMAKMKTVFLKGTAEKGLGKKKAVEIWGLIKKFAEYGFNKSHAVCYAILAYRTAYLKRHYPAEYMAACLTSEIGTVSKLRFLVKEAVRMGVTVAGPSVNQGLANFVASSPDEIVYSLAAVKNVGTTPADEIVAARNAGGEFKTIFDLCAGVALVEESSGLNRRALESLILAGATDCLEGNRAQQLAVMEQALDYASASRKHRDSGQMSLFGDAGEQPVAPALPSVDEFPLEDKLEKEKEMLGFYFSGHPLDMYAEEVSGFTTHFADQISSASPGFVSVAGAVTQVKKVNSRNGQMAFITITGRKGSAEVLCFSDILEKYGDLITTGALVLLEGELKRGKGGRENKMLVDRVIPLHQCRTILHAGIFIDVDGFQCGIDTLEKVASYLKLNPGEARVFMRVRFPSGRVVDALSRSIKVKPDDSVLAGLRNILPEESSVSLCRNDGRFR